MSAVAAGIGAVGGMVSSYFGYKAQKRYVDWLKKFYGPDLAAKRVALPALTQLALGYYGPRVGKESGLLSSQHTLNLGDIARQMGTAQRSSSRYWSLRGDTGRGRGEALRIRMAGTRERNLENLGYAQAQEQYKAQNAGAYAGILGQLAGYGAAANPYASGIAKLGMGASQGLFGDIAAFIGDMAALYPFGGQKDDNQNTEGNSTGTGTATQAAGKPITQEPPSATPNKGATFGARATPTDGAGLPLPAAIPSWREILQWRQWWKRRHPWETAPWEPRQNPNLGVH